MSITLRSVSRRLPGYRHLSSLIRRFNVRYCRGVFRTFQDASAAIRPARLNGYDHAECSDMYTDWLDWVRPSDHAPISWLRVLLAEARSVFDFGGNLGASYYAYQSHLRYPPGLSWLICDVPAVMDAGRALALKKGAAHLSFTTDFRHADGCEVLLTNGTLQYVEQDLASLLAPLGNRPRHLLINRVAFSDRPTYFTIQDIGTACCPYRISNEAEFAAALGRLGYSPIDSWLCEETTCRILFHPLRRVKHFKGMYFRMDVDQPKV